MNTGELQVNFLIKASSALSQIESNKTQQTLRSLYLMRCYQLTGSFRLPQKHFSHETRCSHCLIEWTKETERKVKPIKLSKRQRRRIRSNLKLKKKAVNKEYLLHSNNMEKVCSFCSHKTIMPIIKLNETYKHIIEEKPCKETTKILKKQNIYENKQNNDKMYQSNVYCESKEAFSLSTQNNTLPCLIKQTPKIIKNNKKKKDKFAGLSHIAVMAAAKLKQDKVKPNKLSLFLKPSSLNQP